MQLNNSYLIASQEIYEYIFPQFPRNPEMWNISEPFCRELFHLWDSLELREKHSAWYFPLKAMKYLYLDQYIFTKQILAWSQIDCSPCFIIIFCILLKLFLVWTVDMRKKNALALLFV